MSGLEQYARKTSTLQKEQTVILKVNDTWTISHYNKHYKEIANGYTLAVEYDEQEGKLSSLSLHRFWNFNHFVW